MMGELMIVSLIDEITTMEPACLRGIQRLRAASPVRFRQKGDEGRGDARSGGLSRVEDTEDVDTKDLVEVVGSQLERRLDDRDTRVCDDALDLAEVLLDLRKRRLDLVCIRDVALVRLDRLAPLLREARGDFVGVLGRVVDDGDRRVRLRERLGDADAETTLRTSLSVRRTSERESGKAKRTFPPVTT